MTRRILVSLLAVLLGACADFATQDETGPVAAQTESLATDYRRTVIFIYGVTQPGQDMFIRGGLDHGKAHELLGRTCSSSNTECAIPIVHNNLKNATTAPWKAGDGYLDWYGREATQTGKSGGKLAEGTALDWTTNFWPPAWGATRTVAVDGYGYDAPNMYCSRGFPAGDTSWFEVKSYISNGPGWESDVHQAGTPYSSINHFAQCGKVNVFRRGDSSALYLPLGALTDAYLVGAGDIAYSNDGKTRTAALLESLAPGADYVFTAGDNVQGPATSVTDKAAEFATWFEPTWGAFKDQIAPAMGNHDYMAAAGQAYYDYFGAAAGEAGEGYYSYDIGARWHAIVLNSNDVSTAQLAWLHADLDASAGRHVLAYWHHFSSGEHGNTGAVAPIWDLLVSHGVELVVNGHDHDYERFAPQDASGAASAAGVREFVVGTGGIDERPFASIKSNSEVRNSDTWGVLKLVLHDSFYEWVFVPVAGGAFFDSGFTACHAP